LRTNQTGFFHRYCYPGITSTGEEGNKKKNKKTKEHRHHRHHDHPKAQAQPIVLQPLSA